MKSIEFIHDNLHRQVTVNMHEPIDIESSSREDLIPLLDDAGSSNRIPHKCVS